MRRRSSGCDAAKAQIWARGLVQREDWLVFDVETTGLEDSAEIVEVGAVGPLGETILDLLVKPKCPVDYLSSPIHGLEAAKLEQAPSFETVYALVSRKLCGHRVIAYNAEFDQRVLDNACRKAGFHPVSCVWDCAMARYEQWRGFRASLANACEIEGIATLQRHRALPDALLVWQLLRKMAGEPGSIRSLTE
jgi:DNA polymerase-3 subunit epsilon